MNLLENYPEHMSLEQMRLVCHISKKTTRLLLQNGLVPCVCNGKKTHAYKINKADVIEYLRQREIIPEKYVLLSGCYAHDDLSAILYADFIIENYVDPLIYEGYPDILAVKQAAKLSDVAPKTITIWANRKYFIAF